MKKLKKIIKSKKKNLLILVLILAIILGINYPICKLKVSVITFYNNIGPQAAIVIDDFGNNGEGTEKMLTEIKAPLTCAIMPFMPYSKEEAKLAHSLGHEVIIHLPMQPHTGNPKWLGEKGITTDLSTDEIKSILREAIEEVPFAVGLNNHMGSKATEDLRIMTAIIEVLKEHNMYIVDSRTSSKSVVEEVAKAHGVSVRTRDVFIDNNKDYNSIKNQLQQLKDLAMENGKAIGIGHVGPEGGTVTAKGIKDMIHEFENKGVKIVPVSELLE
ncbi:divergent polysaccharide deacetylase family protein [Serpentinicella sp. ANB-PHB4]|uniref:divergent polysaccharide deacetylase family protein n=1 Tax=Serpentinicella sp. ANB-PHB4 TaxID=3074076 RepID=UPI0028659C84|nr:divergent polysaccharide deacetylase family protein [Serpentinicella sp. ANB-PHB4]MDR5659513.1 divergent polysaccharide deacetylase family protein [Serpentinicella sp. ANB-PHB4]